MVYAGSYFNKLLPGLLVVTVMSSACAPSKTTSLTPGQVYESCECYEVKTDAGDLPVEVLQQISPTIDYFLLEGCELTAVDTTKHLIPNPFSPPWIFPEIKPCLFNDFLVVVTPVGTNAIVYQALQSRTLDSTAKVTIYDEVFFGLPPGVYDYYYFHNQVLRAKHKALNLR